MVIECNLVREIPDKQILGMNIWEELSQTESSTKIWISILIFHPVKGNSNFLLKNNAT